MTKATRKQQQELKQWLLDHSTHTHQPGDSEVKPVVCHGDGTVSVRATFFYKHGRSAESHGEAVTADLQKEGAPQGWKVVRVREANKQWPSESFFEATFAMAGAGE